MMGKNGAYKPTKKEQILVETLLNPKNRMKNIMDVCRIAGCGKNTYYRAFEKKGFNEYYKQCSLEMVDKNIGQVMSSFVSEAKRGSFQHGKILLEMSGMYKEKQEIEHSGAVTNVMIDNMTDQQKADRIKELKKKMGK